MDSKDNELARQQQERRKRVSRIKTGIIMTIAIWIAISILAIVVLGIMVVKLNSRIYKLGASVKYSYIKHSYRY